MGGDGGSKPSHSPNTIYSICCHSLFCIFITSILFLSPFKEPANASERAISWKFLKQFVETIPKDYTTGDVVFKIIIDATKGEKVQIICGIN